MTSPTNLPPTLDSLPPEIHLLIIDNLPWRAVLSLRLTSQTFLSLIPKSTLEPRHTTLATQLYTTEKAHLHRLDLEYWSLAYEVFLGISPNYSSSYTGDPDLDALSKNLTCSTDFLPCYTCLRWLPSCTSPPKFATECAFSRGRCTGQFDLGGKSARERMCIECGIRRGVYARGTIVKQSVICVECGKLGEPFVWDRRVSGDDDRPLGQGNWWRQWLCGGCWEGGEMGVWSRDRVLTRWTRREQFVHEGRSRRYEEGMRRGKEYRMEKGRRLRRDRGIFIGEDGAVVIDRGPGARYCPVVGEHRLCSCDTQFKPGYGPSTVIYKSLN